MKVKIAQLAEKMAYRSQFKVRVGCVIARGNQVISIGVNNGTKTHPRSPHPFHSLHAEVDAVVSAKGEDLSNCSIYVARILKNNTLAISKPCQYCESLLRRVGIKEVFYSTEDGWQTINYGETSR